MIVEHITYHEIDGTYDSNIFTERMPENASKALRVSKGVQDYVFPDSAGKRKFAEDLDTSDEVVVYAKLPRTFQIPTPVGNYAPDWAIAFKQGSVRHVFFVAETKGSLDSLELRGVESAKIACAKKLFKNHGAHYWNGNVARDIDKSHIAANKQDVQKRNETEKRKPRHDGMQHA